MRDTQGTVLHLSSTAGRRLGAAAVVLACALPAVAASQAPSAGLMADDRAGQACLDTLSDANLTRVTVSQRAVVAEVNPAVLTQSALISQHIAAAARAAPNAARAAAATRSRQVSSSASGGRRSNTCRWSSSSTATDPSRGIATARPNRSIPS